MANQKITDAGPTSNVCPRCHRPCGTVVELLTTVARMKCACGYRWTTHTAAGLAELQHCRTQELRLTDEQRRLLSVTRDVFIPGARVTKASGLKRPRTGSA